MIVIDGSYGEGGGQILRSSLCMSCITGKAFHIYNIRKGRKKPGLMQQHLTSVQAAREISDADVKGAEYGSTELEFRPKTLKSGKFIFDVAEERGSAGSTALVLQAIMVPLLKAKNVSEIILKGGTHTEWSPPYHYLEWVLFPMLKKLGIKIESKLKKWGFYPRGGGEIYIKINPVEEIKNWDFTERGRLQKLWGISVVCDLPRHIAERQRRASYNLLRRYSPEIEIWEVKGLSKGTFFFLVAEYENSICGFSSLGAPGKPAEKVGEEATEEFLKHEKRGGALDKHLADQIINFLTLGKGEFRFTTSEITLHLLTNIWVIKKFKDVEIKIKGKEGERGEILIKI